MSPNARSAVLFVDDEPQVLRGFRDGLRKEPYDILTAGSAALALGILSRNHIDVIISDDRMPVMSGGELLERIRREYPSIVRIMLTGEASLDASMRAIKGGLYRFLTKPIEPAALRQVIAAALTASSRATRPMPRARR